MNSALQKVDYFVYGANKKTVEDSFQIMANQARWMEQTLMIQIEGKIEREFKQKETEIVTLLSFIKNMEKEVLSD